MQKAQKGTNLTDFIHFINDETLIASDLIFSNEAVEQYNDKKTNSRRTKVSSFATKDKWQSAC